MMGDFPPLSVSKIEGRRERGGEGDGGEQGEMEATTIDGAVVERDRSGFEDEVDDEDDIRVGQGDDNEEEGEGEGEGEGDGERKGEESDGDIDGDSSESDLEDDISRYRREIDEQHRAKTEAESSSAVQQSYSSNPLSAVQAADDLLVSALLKVKSHNRVE